MKTYAFLRLKTGALSNQGYTERAWPPSRILRRFRVFISGSRILLASREFLAVLTKLYDVMWQQLIISVINTPTASMGTKFILAYCASQ